MAEQEGWNQKKIMHYFNNMQAFEKFYNNVSMMNSVLSDSDPPHFDVDIVAKKAAGYRRPDPELRQALDGRFAFAPGVESPR